MFKEKRKNKPPFCRDLALSPRVRARPWKWQMDRDCAQILWQSRPELAPGPLTID
jgi:hypothetical protein